jgi:hypothetical protein
MKPLKNVVPRSDDVFFVVYDFETTQDTKFVSVATLHAPNLVCLQQFCTQCEQQPDIDVDCLRCGKRRHSFFEYPVGDLLTYLCKPRRWCNKIIAIAHNAKSFDSQFILHRTVVLKWKPELILNGLKIVCMKMEHMTFLDSASYLPMALRKLPEAFDLSVKKSWYPHCFNTKNNLDYVGPMPGIEYFGADEMGECGRRDLLPWYAEQKDEVFDNRRALEENCQDDVTVLREACKNFTRDFMEIGNIDFFWRQSP